MKVDWLLKNISIASMACEHTTPFGAIDQGAVAVKDGTITWVGTTHNMPTFDADDTIDGAGQWLTPGLIDCHTHIVYAGNRAEEFQARLQGKSYQDIARMGGGINNTVNATRNASEQDLFSSAVRRLERLMREGVTTIEIKSGYGLDLHNELKLLRVNQQLKQQCPMTIKSTFLGLHALPPEYQHRDDYVQVVCEQILPTVAQHQLADAVDVFCEHIGFTVQQCERCFSTAKHFKLNVKGHVEQLSYQGGARLVAAFNGLSVDHIEYLPTEDIEYLHNQNTTAVILPTPFYFLKEKQKPPVRALQQAGVAIAIASDHNPGSSPSLSLLTAMNQACVLFELTPEQALAGTTRNAAKALGLQTRKGQVKAGFDADLLLWDISHPAELSYGINMYTPSSIWIAGKHV